MTATRSSFPRRSGRAIRSRQAGRRQTGRGVRRRRPWFRARHRRHRGRSDRAHEAIIITSPNNPTGAVWSRETIRAIGEWAVEHHVWVISDEIYEHLNYDGAKTAYVASRSPNAATSCWCSTASPKPHAMPGWRVGGWSPPRPSPSRRQAAGPFELQRFQRSAASGARRRRGFARRGAYDARVIRRPPQGIVAALNDIPGVHCPTPTGAFYAFPDVTGLLGKPLGENGTVVNTSSELAAALLDEAHVAAVPGEAFGAPGYLRFSYALADDQSPRACAGSAAGSAETVARGRARYLPRTPRHTDYAPVETRDWTKSAIPASMASWRFCQVTDT